MELPIYLKPSELSMTIKAASDWKSNAELIRDVAQLGYLKKDVRTLDPTYGNGIWWKLWRPDALIALNRSIDGTDFRDLEYPDESFGQIAYDPPYVSKGGRKTSGIQEMDRRYGMEDAPTSPASLQRLINDGLTEMARLVKPGGIILCKCQDYISSGKLWTGTFHTHSHAVQCGLKVEDIFVHHGGSRPQPPGRRQVHARRNLSHLFVFKKPR